MAKTKKVIAPNNLPVKFPLFPTLTLWLFLDRIQAPNGVYYICFSIMGIIWMAAFGRIYNENKVDLFEMEKDEPKESKWQERVKEMQEKHANQ